MNRFHAPYTTDWFHHARIQARARQAGWDLHQQPLSAFGGEGDA